MKTVIINQVANGYIIEIVSAGYNPVSAQADLLKQTLGAFMQTKDENLGIKQEEKEESPFAPGSYIFKELSEALAFVSLFIEQ